MKDVMYTLQFESPENKEVAELESFTKKGTFLMELNKKIKELEKDHELIIVQVYTAEKL